MPFDYRFEVKIAADRIRLIEDAYLFVAAGEHPAIAQGAIAQRQRRLVQNHDVDFFAVQQALECIDERQAKLECLVERNGLRCKDGNIDIGEWRRTAASVGAK